MALAHKFPKMCLQFQSWIWLCRNFARKRNGVIVLALDIICTVWVTASGSVNTVFPLSSSWHTTASVWLLIYTMSKLSPRKRINPLEVVIIWRSNSCLCQKIPWGWNKPLLLQSDEVFVLLDDSSGNVWTVLMSSSSVNNCAWEAWHWDSQVHQCLACAVVQYHSWEKKYF